jgi:anti-sigma factor RsiW
MDIPAHQAVQELLPWYATSQLAPEDVQRVQEHLQGCAQCRQELEWERDMRAEAAASADAVPDGVDMERALARLLPALGPQDATVTSVAAESAVSAATTGAAPLPWWRKPASNQPSWLRWAVAAQWVLIAGLAVLLARPQEEPAAYRVLGSGVSATGNLVVVFQPNTSERDLRRILQAQGARVVDGPTVTDAYLLNVPSATRDQALQALRAESAVKLAEPLDAGSTP